MNSINGLKIELLANVDTVVKYLLPNGKQVSNEWRAGSVGGEEGNSLGVSLSGCKAGVWCDFAGNESGDLLDLWSACREVDFVTAMKEASDFVGYAYEPQRKLKPQKKYKKPQRPNVSKLSEKTIAWFANRKINEATLKKFKVAEENGNIAFPYLSPEGELERVKFRALNEKKIWSSTD